MRALVTGGGGFLGGAIVRLLREEGVEVRTFSRRRYPWLDSLGVEQIQGNLTEESLLSESVQGCDTVFHVAARVGLWGDYREFYRTNVIGTENVISACRQAGVSRLVYTSSPSVVFHGRDMEGVDESVPYPSRFKAAYPATKAAAEQRVLAANGPGLATVALRPHLIWGPEDSHLVPGILERARQGKLRRIGKADKRVDFTYVDNAALAHWLAAQRLEAGSPVAGRAYFITQGEPVFLWDFINRLLEVAGLPPVTRSVPKAVAYSAAACCELLYRILPLKGEPLMTRFLVEELTTAHWYDIGAARRDLGYSCRVDTEEGLKRLRETL